MITEYQVSELVPHSGKMSLLTRITGYGEDWLTAQVLIKSDTMFADARGVPAWVGLEYLAQAIGAFAGLQERLQGSEPKVGFLLGSRKYSCTTDYFCLGDSIDVKVVRNMQADNGLSAFDGHLVGSGYEATARLNVFQPENAAEFLRNVKG